jgi:hypothetical protein
MLEKGVSVPLEVSDDQMVSMQDEALKRAQNRARVDAGKNRPYIDTTSHRKRPDAPEDGRRYVGASHQYKDPLRRIKSR